MIIYNTVKELQENEMYKYNGLTAEHVEQKIILNDAQKVHDRVVIRFEDLPIEMLEWSIRDNYVNVQSTVNHRDTSKFTTFDYLKQRTHGEVSGLIVDLIEKRDKYLNVRSSEIRFIKPLKKYKATIKLYKSYTQNIKY